MADQEEAKEPDTGDMVEQLADLLTICNGAAVEKFFAELEKVKANIKDPNTEADDVRTIVLKFRFAPDKDRERVIVDCKADSRLSATRASGDVMFLGKRDGELVATVVHPQGDPRQGVLTLGRKVQDA